MRQIAAMGAGVTGTPSFNICTVPLVNHGLTSFHAAEAEESALVTLNPEIYCQYVIYYQYITNSHIFTVALIPEMTFERSH